jgi:alcohol dehydrogenase class IV
LENAGFAVDIFKSEAKVLELEEAKKIINIIQGKDYGLVVGIDCGAVTDRAKIVALKSETDGGFEEYVFPSTKPLTGSKPKILISTTSVTGSECIRR